MIWADGSVVDLCMMLEVCLVSWEEQLHTWEGSTSPTMAMVTLKGR